MKKLGVVIVDGVGYRNFILSNFLQEVSNKFDKIVIYSGLKERVYNLDNYNNIKVVELEIYRENRQAWFYRKLNETAHLFKYKSFFGINDTLNFTKPKGYSKRAILNRIIRAIASFFYSDKNMQKYQELIYKSFSKSSIVQAFFEILKNDNPTILFFSHQRPPYLAPLVYAANLNKIKTCSFIFSWDNLASKGRIPAMFDSFLVWSDLMKSELQHFYPNVKNNNIHVVGTPQFEPYIMEKFESLKEDFDKKFELDSTKKIICFSCGDLSTGKNDVLAIKIIADAIIKNRINESVILLVRTSPADDGNRFNNIKEKYPFIRWNKPKWIQTREGHVEPWSQRVPLEEDVKDLRAILEYSDLSINMCSTMSLDFMIFNKPVINQVLGNENNGLFNDQRFLNYDHYKKVVDSNAVIIAKSEKELITAINESLRYPLKLEQERKNILDIEISQSIKGTSKRIVETLLKISNE